MVKLKVNHIGNHPVLQLLFLRYICVDKGESSLIISEVDAGIDDDDNDKQVKAQIEYICCLFNDAHNGSQNSITAA